jgi:four helix bundle protein
MEKKIVSFTDLIVYQNTYKSAIIVMTKIITNLPESEKYDLKDQLARAAKAIPRLIAEGYAKRQQKFGFQKYLADAMAECNETIVSLSQCRDIYPNYLNIVLCEELIKSYDIAGRQIYKLSESWSKFKRQHLSSST